MPRETSPYIVGDFWLDKRRDGLSPDIWQIAWNEARSVRYKSTRCRSLDDARSIIDAHHAAHISKQPQRPDDAMVVPLLMLYWSERGQKARGPSQIASSLRQFIAFLDQDKATVGVTVASLTGWVGGAADSVEGAVARSIVSVVSRGGVPGNQEI